MKNKTAVLTVCIFLIICGISLIIRGFLSAGGSEKSSTDTSSADTSSADTSSAGTSRYIFEENLAESGIYEVGTEEGRYWGDYYIPNIGFSAGKRVVYNGSLPLLNWVIPDSSLAVLTKEELRLLRNTIFAKHGMIFESEDLKNHFQQFGWYRPMRRNVDSQLTEVDGWNITNIQFFENARPNSNLNKRDLVGNWWMFVPVPNWTPEFFILDNDIIEFTGGGEDSWKGRFRLENGFLVVYIQEQYLGSTDHYFFNNNWRWPEGIRYKSETVINEWGEYTRNVVVYDEPIRMVFPIERKRFDESFGTERQQIGSWTEWARAGF